MGCILARFVGRQTNDERGENMPDHELVSLMSALARLTHPRSSTPRAEALGAAYRRLRRFAAAQGESDDWCDRVLLIFLDRNRDAYAAA
jgi:hypothetical protein